MCLSEKRSEDVWGQRTRALAGVELHGTRRPKADRAHQSTPASTPFHGGLFDEPNLLWIRFRGGRNCLSWFFGCQISSKGGRSKSGPALFLWEKERMLFSLKPAQLLVGGDHCHLAVLTLYLYLAIVTNSLFKYLIATLFLKVHWKSVLSDNCLALQQVFKPRPLGACCG